MSWIDVFWAHVYDHRQYGWLLFVLLVFLSLLTVLSLVFGKSGTTSYTISIVNLGLILFVGLLVGTLFGYSHYRRPNE
ncbi:hypothetical protein [Halocatena pleomorpha]|uniref:Uncharacterized protein n=1 Tax=Halocatena pleomorpha TaxID=1785090 RepID=A0A3P3R8G4_9EURY|nr:hypothetical protein [Halocatena pleomorpha]RRJ29664.1 hypothetical protein EIK79_11935 [Halocatena pleomorpha]